MNRGHLFIKLFHNHEKSGSFPGEKVYFKKSNLKTNKEFITNFVQGVVATEIVRLRNNFEFQLVNIHIYICYIVLC